MPGIDGIETLKEIKKSSAASLPVIIITGHGNVETAVKATKLGAFDLIEKPLNIDKVIVSINNALNFRRLEEENRYPAQKNPSRSTPSAAVSAPVQALNLQIATVAPTESWVLIKGENGTGKELVARTIHQLSPAGGSPHDRRQLRGHSRNTHRKRAVWPRKRWPFQRLQHVKMRGKFETGQLRHHLFWTKSGT